jgi:hypothetical protein
MKIAVCLLRAFHAEVAGEAHTSVPRGLAAFPEVSSAESFAKQEP